jgi:uncharacterized hydrophobic protein (TIGR00271 family)
MKPELLGTMAAVLGPSLGVTIQMQWAIRLATACRKNLVLIQPIEDRDDRVVDIPLDQPPEKDPSGVVQEVIRIIGETSGLEAGPAENADEDVAENADEGEAEAEGESQVIHVRFRRIHYASASALRKFLLSEVKSNKVELMTAASQQPANMEDADLVRERRLFLRHLPCKLVLCRGLKEGADLSCILVAANVGQNEKAAMQLGLDLAAPVDGTVTALYVNPEVGAESTQVGDRRLNRVLRKLQVEVPDSLKRRIAVDNQPLRGVRQVWDEGNHDLVLMGAPRSMADTNLSVKLGKNTTFAMVKAASPIRNTLKKWLDQSINRVVPQIEREDRIALVDRLQSNAAWNFDFLTLMVLSTVIAAVGLIQNSAAVVIGAMLVAPLMTPLLGLGLALVQGNPVLARVSLRSATLGLLVSLLGGFMVGICTLNFGEPTREMLARGGPGLLDLFVAFASGLAAAYASSRPGLIAALPGVAIAAALVPPIATSGLALALGDFPLALGSLLLFGINMVTIVFASMASLRAVGIRNLKKPSRWIMVVGRTVMVAVLALGVYLSLNPKDYELTEQFPEGLVAAVQESLGTDYRLDNLAVAYDELGVQLNVNVVGKTPASEEIATEVRTVASDHYDQPVRVRLLTHIEIDLEPVK